MKTAALPLEYEAALQLARTVLQCRPGREKYRDGVVEEAARRATGLKNQLNIIDAVTTAFEAYRISINPRWDGSIA